MEDQNDKYIAFISYRHKPLDMTVAEELIKLIEHYRVPKDLRQDGSTSLGRVFRDRDELGVHHDLEDAIYPALDKSTFLIVVCTPDTQDSPWIKLEIQRFLQNHPRDNILVVHAAGTAEEAIPEEITHIYDGEGNLTSIETPLSIFLVDSNQQKVLSNLRKEFLRIAAFLMHAPYESLIRQKEFETPRKYLKKEFLRLVAALLGCPYDVLVQRNKRYLYQRLMVFSLVIAAFLLVFALVVFSKNRQISAMNQQIQEQLLQTQLNESEILTLMSRQQLEDGDRMNAIRSAINALPREGVERPYYPEAANALSEALNLYTPNGTLMTHSLMEIPVSITDMAISNDGEYAAILNEGDILQYYHIPSGKILWEIYHNENPMTIEEEVEHSQLPVAEQDGIVFLKFSNDGQRIIHATYTTTCVLSAATGEHIYTLDYPLAWGVELSDNDKFLVTHDKNDRYTFYSFGTGKLLSEMDMCSLDGGSFYGVEASCFSQSLDLFFAVVSEEEPKYYVSDGNRKHLFLLNPITGKVIRHETVDGEDIFSAGPVIPMPDGGFAVFFDPIRDVTGSTCIFLDASGKIRMRQHYLNMDSPYWSSPWKDYLISISEKTLYLSAIADGNPIAYYNLPSPIIRHYFDGQDSLVLFLEDHTIRQISLELETSGPLLKEASQLPYDSSLENIYMPRKDGSVYCLVPSQYAADQTAQFVCQMDYQNPEILGWDQYDSSVTVSPSGNYFMFYNLGLTFDSVTKEMYDRKTPEKEKNLMNWFSGFAADESKMIYSSGILFDTISGKSKKIELWNDLPELTPGYLTTVSNSGDTIVFNDVSRGWERILYQVPGEPLLSATYHEGRIHWWLDDVHHFGSPCPFTDRMALIPETTNVFVGKNGLILLRIPKEQIWTFDHYSGSSETAAYVIYSIDDDTWYWLDYPILPEAKFGYVPTSSEKWIAFMDNSKTFYLYDPAAGTTITQFQVPFTAESVEMVHFMKNDTILFVSLSNDITYLIDTKSGSVLGDPIPGKYDALQFDTEQNRLFLSNYYYGAIVDMENWCLIKRAPSMRGYLPASDQIICYDEPTGKYLFYHVYSVEEMIELGLNITGS